MTSSEPSLPGHAADHATQRGMTRSLESELQAKLDCALLSRDEARAEVERMRPVVEAAIAISDADLIVYDDFPEAHDLMNKLDTVVDAYRG